MNINRGIRRLGIITIWEIISCVCIVSLSSLSSVMADYNAATDDLSATWSINNSTGIVLDGNELGYANHTGQLTITSDPTITLSNGAVFEHSGPTNTNGKAIITKGDGTFKISGHNTANTDRLQLYSFYFMGGGSPVVDTSASDLTTGDKHSYLMLKGSSTYGIARFENDGELIIGRNTFPDGVTSTAVIVLEGANAKISQSASPNADPNSGLNLVNATVDFKVAGTLETSARIFDEPEKYGSNTGSLIKSGAGTMTITNSNNTYVKPTAINGGKLILSGEGNLTKTSGVSIASGATLEFTNSNSDGEGGIVTFDRSISGAGAVVKSGTGTVKLSVANSYTGPTTISGGTLIAAGYTSNNITAIGSGALTLSNATLDLIKGYLPASSVTIEGDSTLKSSEGWNCVKNISGSGTLTLTGVGYLAIKSGYAANNFTGTIVVGTNETMGGLGLETANVLNNATSIRLVNGSIDGRDLAQSFGSFEYINGTLKNMSGTMTLSNEFKYNSSTDLTVPSVIAGTANLVKEGTGALTLSGSNAYTGSTTVSGGTLIATGFTGNNITAIGSGPLTLSNATLDLIKGYLPASSVTVEGDSVLKSSSWNCIKNISGSGTLTLTGAGYLAIKSGYAANNFTGTLVIGTKETTGGLSLEDANVLNNTTSIRLVNGSIDGRDLAQSFGSFEYIDGTLKNMSGTMTLSNEFKYNSSTDLTFPGVISGTANLVKEGEGTLTLSKAPEYSGTTTVSSGALALSEGGSLNNLSGGSLNDDGSIKASATIDASGQNLTLNNSESTQFIGAVTAQSIEKTGDGILKIFTGDQKVVANNFLVSSGELDVKGYFEGNLEVVNNAIFSPGNSVGTVNVDGNVAFTNASASSNGIALIEFGEYTGQDENHDVFVLDADNIFTADDSVFTLAFENNDANLWASSGSEYKLVANGGFSDGTDYSAWLSNYTDLFSLTGRSDGLYLVGMASPDPSAGVPEPSTWALLLLGVSWLLYWRKRR